MKLFVLGASGATGKEFVSQALAAGHEVTAYVRDAGRVEQSDPDLIAVVGSVTNAEGLAKAMAGHQAVVGMLGTGRRPSTLISASTAALVPAAGRAGVRRVVVLSAFGVGESLAKAGRVARLAYRTVAAPVFRDKAKGETTLRASDLDWTIAYPVTLNTKAATGHYTATALAETPDIPGVPTMPRGDVAAFLLSTAIEGSHIRQMVVLRS